MPTIASCPPTDKELALLVSNVKKMELARRMTTARNSISHSFRKDHHHHLFFTATSNEHGTTITKEEKETILEHGTTITEEEKETILEGFLSSSYDRVRQR